MRVIIIGCGRQGARLAQLLEAEGHEVTVVDKNVHSFKRLEKFRGNRIFGNGIDIDILKKAGIDKADAFAAVTNGDNTNLMTAQIAQEIFKVPKVVCRVYDPQRAGIYYQLGLKTVCSTTVGARMLRNIIIAPAILRHYQLGDATAQAIEIKIGEAAVGKKIGDLTIKDEFVISCIIREGKPFFPTPEEITKSGDQIFGVVKTSSLEKLKQLMGVTDFAANYLKEETIKTV